MLIIIFLLVGVMTVFNYLIRFREGSRYYPALYILFGLSIIASLYYIFQTDLPKVADTPCIGWICNFSAVGTLWGIVGIIVMTVVSFCIFIATMQILAQVSVEAGMSLEEKRWKEWKLGLAIVLLGICIAGITYVFNRTASGWTLVITAILTVAFTIFKIVRDTIYCGNFLWALLIGVIFLIGTFVSMTLFLEVIHACVYLVVFLAVFMSQAKARKKKKRNKEFNV